MAELRFPSCLLWRRRRRDSRCRLVVARAHQAAGANADASASAGNRAAISRDAAQRAFWRSSPGSHTIAVVLKPRARARGVFSTAHKANDAHASARSPPHGKNAAVASDERRQKSRCRRQIFLLLPRPRAHFLVGQFCAYCCLSRSRSFGGGSRFCSSESGDDGGDDDDDDGGGSSSGGSSSSSSSSSSGGGGSGGGGRSGGGSGRSECQNHCLFSPPARCRRLSAHRAVCRSR